MLLLLSASSLIPYGSSSKPKICEKSLILPGSGSVFSLEGLTTISNLISSPLPFLICVLASVIITPSSEMGIVVLMASS